MSTPRSLQSCIDSGVGFRFYKQTWSRDVGFFSAAVLVFFPGILKIAEIRLMAPPTFAELMNSKDGSRLRVVISIKHHTQVLLWVNILIKSYGLANSPKVLVQSPCLHHVFGSSLLVWTCQRRRMVCLSLSTGGGVPAFQDKVRDTQPWNPHPQHHPFEMICSHGKHVRKPVGPGGRPWYSALLHYISPRSGLEI